MKKTDQPSAQTDQPSPHSAAGNLFDIAFPAKKILVTGGTGFIGKPLVQMLCDSGCSLKVLTRNPSQARQHQPNANISWVSSFDEIPNDGDFDVLINLAGESLAEGRWTATKKQRLMQSRIGTTSGLYDLVARLARKPEYLISGSAIGFYGPQSDWPLSETSATVDSFSHRLCSAWEAEAQRLTELGVAVCCVRLGVVLAEQNGAFAAIQQSFRVKVATQMGAGKQVFSWVHRRDVLRALAFLLALPPTERLTGPVNLTAPNAINYTELCDKLAQHHRTLVKLSLPSPLLRLILGEMANELLLTGQRVVPQRLLAQGFEFCYPTFDQVLASLP
jgi:uncharacterized protein (TIGR01777 family)